MSRFRYLVGARSSEPLTARPICSMVRSHPVRGASLQRRIEPEPAGVAATAPKRSRCSTGQKRMSVMPAIMVIPATITKDRSAVVSKLMMGSHLDLGDPPDGHEADRLEDE